MLRRVLRRQGPVYARDFPDPFVLTSGGRYFAYATQTGSINVQMMESGDLVQWTHRGDALAGLPAWARPGHTWSPAVLDRDGRYVLYYVVRQRASDRQSITVATAADPAGPFVDTSGEPLVFQAERGGSIDPSPFIDGDGTAYLLWKSDDNALGRPSSLWAAPLRSDGLALAGDPVELLRQDLPWEAPTIEAPSLVSADRRYFLFYSGGWWQSAGYGVGYARALEILGPYSKATRRRPWLGSAAGMTGPGGAEVFTDAAGELRIAYHAWASGRVGYAAGGVRSLWIRRLGFRDGQPVLTG